MTLEMFHKTEDEHYDNLFNQLEASSENMSQITKKHLDFQDLFGSYGKHKRDVLDTSFNTIIENLVPEIFRLRMLTIDNDIPKSRKDIEKIYKDASIWEIWKVPRWRVKRVNWFNLTN